METVQPERSLHSILVVEDDHVAIDILGLMIKKKFPDFEIHTAENGLKGLELFKRYRPDIVLTDINMPEMNGMDMAAEIRSMDPDAKFIVLTAYNDLAFFEKFNEIGFVAYILKPIEFKKLFVAIEKCIS
jgi:YesN/AraC family two-component response regulator